MRSRILLAAAIAGLAFGRARAATSGNAPVTATIQAIDALSLTNSGTITLSGAAGSNTLTGPSDSSALLNYSHNSATAGHVTAQVLSGNVPAGQDITLTVSVAGGDGAKTLLASGAGQAAQTVWSGIAAGAYANKAITYTASCTASGTKVSADTTFNIVVTFTSTP